MAATSKWCGLIVWFTTVVLCSGGAKLNVPKILLPYDSFMPTNFTVFVNEGCYKWRSSRPDVATVTPLGPSEEDRCSSHASVSAVSKSPVRQTTIIMAEDPDTGKTFRCDVIVDVVFRLEIKTTTRQLYLDDSPEKFVVRGMDDEGNTFTTLDGVTFDWTLITDHDTDENLKADQVLKILPFSESSYQTPEHIKILQRKGKKGNKILVEGIRTGTANVSAIITDPGYKALKTPPVRLVVIANIMLNPQVVYLMQFAEAHFKVEQLKKGKIREIMMPSQQFYFKLVDEKICSLDADTSTVTALDYGDTQLQLHDRNIKLKGAFKEPHAQIYVVEPAYLVFLVHPGKKWVLETGRDYEVTIEIYNEDHQKIHPSNNVRLKATFPDRHFNVTSSLNGTYHVVHTKEKGFTEIQGQLKVILKKDGSEYILKQPIENSQDVEIYDPIQVEPPVLVFPWNPVDKKPYNHTQKIKATGGSGNYSMTSSNKMIATVSGRGAVTPVSIGECVVRVADKRHSAHHAEVQVYVLPPTDMYFNKTRVETPVGTYLDLPLVLLGKLKPDSEAVMFNDCSYIPMRVTLNDETVFQFKEGQDMLAPRDSGCARVRVHANEIGHTEVKVQYTYADVHLEASIVIAAYKPLKPVDPETVAVVAVGSSYEVVFDGGPQPWVLDQSKYFQTAHVGSTDLVSLSAVHMRGIHRNFHSVWGLCKELGEQDLTMKVGNGPTSKNPFPATETARIRFICAHPTGLLLTPVVRHPELKLPPCPVTPDSGEPIPSHINKDLDIMVAVTDKEGRKFNNFSSLALDWEISDPVLATFDSQGAMTTEVTVQETGRKEVKVYQTLLTKNKLGSLSVTVTINKYDTSYFTKQRITFDENVSPPLSRTLILSLVEDATITPETAYMFNHPSNKVQLKLIKGSGYFHLDHSESGIAKVTYEQMSRSVRVSPLADGTLKITVYDLCLSSPEPPQATVYISGVHIVELKVIDKVELHKEIKASVRVLDRNKQPILAEYFPLLNLKAQLGSEIISVRPDPGKPVDKYTASFIVHGAALGDTTLAFTASPREQHSISSILANIQVFPPLRLDPRNVTLIIGASIHVTAQGGPQPESDIEFEILQSNVAHVSSSGLVDAKALGSTRVVGRAVGYDSKGEKIVYSQDEGQIHVIELAGIRIFAPLKRLQTGTEMPVYAMGVNEHETPFMFGNADIPLKFSWSVKNDRIALKSPFYKSGMMVPAEGNFAMRVFARQAGYVTISLTVSPSEGSRLQLKKNLKLTDEVQLQVFEKLELIEPCTCTGEILVTPNTQTILKTNRDGSAAMTYSVGPSSKPVVKVSKSGQLTTGAHNGQATVIVTAQEDFEVNQTLVIWIKVKPVSYIMLNVDTVFHTKHSRLSAIPVASQVHLSVSFHDNVGSRFYATNSNVNFRTNRYDLMHVSRGQKNNTFVARAALAGATILKVWDEKSTRMADYLNLQVAPAIHPAEVTLTLGDIVCFSTPLVSEEGHSGNWKSNSPKLKMGSDCGIAYAKDIGRVAVFYETSGASVYTATAVDIRPVQSVDIQADDIKYLTTSAGSSRSTVIPVVLQGEYNQQSNFIGANCSGRVQVDRYIPSELPFTCQVTPSVHYPGLDMSNLFHVAAGVDPDSGSYHCKVTTDVPSDLAERVSKLNTDILVKVKVPAREGQPEVTKDLKPLPFMPAFHLHAAEVHLSDLVSTATLRVSASDRIANQLHVVSSDPALLEVAEATRDPHSEGVLSYQLRLVTESPAVWEVDLQDLHLTLTCTLTGQQEKVTIRVKLTKPADGIPKPRPVGWWQLLQAIAENYQSWIFSLLATVAVIIATFIAYHYLFGTRYSGGMGGQGTTYVVQSGSPLHPVNYKPSPLNSPFGTSISPNRVPLWTSGYEAGDSPAIGTPRTLTMSH